MNAAIDEFARLLWPPPVRTHVGRHPPDRGVRPAREYLVLHRLLLPRDRRAAAAAVLGFNTQRSRRAQLLSRTVWAALRTGAGPLALPRLRIYHPAETIEGYLAAALGRQFHLSIHIGPPRANRKPVVQLLTPAGETVAFAKIGVNELTRHLVRAEAAALETLNRAGLRVVSVPGVLHHGQWRGLEVMVLGALPVRRPRTVLTADRLGAVVRDIAYASGVRSESLGTSGYWSGLRQRVSLGDSTASPMLDTVLRSIDRQADRLVLNFGAWHGDLTRWNVACLPETVLVWDWERYSASVPVGFDMLHYQLNDAVVRVGRDQAVPTLLSSASRLLAPFGLEEPASRVTALLYLAEIASRYLNDRQEEAGAELGQAERWLLPHLVAEAAKLPEVVA